MRQAPTSKRPAPPLPVSTREGAERSGTIPEAPPVDTAGNRVPVSVPARVTEIRSEGPGISGAARQRAREMCTIRVRADSVGLVLSMIEALALRRFCEESDPSEFRDVREWGAFHRALDKLFDVTAFSPEEEKPIDDQDWRARYG